MEPPSYAFSIAPMYPKPSIVQRFSPHGRWRPPKALGNNLSLPPAYFYFGGNASTDITISLSALPPNAEEHKTYSIYYDRAIIWTLNYDATKEQVNDGNEDSPSDDPSESDDGDAQAVNRDESEWKDDWAPFKFYHNEDNLLSYAGRRLPHFRLCVRRRDQEWAIKLLPDSSSAESETSDASRGGLIGELPLLIGLMALAVPAAQLAVGLCEAMAYPWTAPQFERGKGWKDQRGLIVKTYTCPGGSSMQDLKNYEMGEHGPILP